MFPPLTAITASDVSYDPANCANLAGTTTVQEAIDVLCKTAPTEEKGIHVEKVVLADGSELLNDSLVHPEQLAGGIRIICSDELFQDSVRNSNGTENPVCLVTLDLPWPRSPTDRDTWGTSNLGFVGFFTITWPPRSTRTTSRSSGCRWTNRRWTPRTWIASTVMKMVEGRPSNGCFADSF